jgi:protein-L-isoaspartate(D-aspartate) O-methyltransferase
MTCDSLYNETHRPQFHFTPKKNWTNDPNGLVYYRGEYHLFFQHNPKGIKWGNMTWGHAISPDLVHWEELAPAIEPDELGTIFSGSAVVDWKNTAGFQTGDENVLVAIYTSAGAHVSPLKPFTQSIACSNDRGRTWIKYEGNPVLGNIKGSNRDPKVIWHEPTEKWVMALFIDGNDYVLFGSPDLKRWEHLSDIHFPGTSECPDIFELPVDGDPDDTRWVFWGANGSYLIGTFDGVTFKRESDVLQAELGANGYAAQTYSDIPQEDGRRIQISWMNGGKYPAMPFNQQMSFPVELTLRTFPEGIRVCRQPIMEIECLHDRVQTWEDCPLMAGQNLIPETDCELFDIRAEIEPGDTDVFGLFVRGLDLRYNVNDRTITFLGKTAILEPVDGRIALRLLIDRTSLEVFGNRGKVSMSFCFLPEAADHNLEVYTQGGTANVVSLTVHELRSAFARGADRPGESVERYRRQALEQMRSYFNPPVSAAVEQAYLETPRHRFITRYRKEDNSEWQEVTQHNVGEHLATLYANQPLILFDDEEGHARSSISQPSLVLFMLDLLRVEPGHRVFELGAGSGWNAAMLGRLVGSTGHVYSLEIIPEVAQRAAATIAALGIPNVSIITGDGGEGYTPGAPYDRAIFTAGTYDLPRPFYAQIKDGGVLLFVLKSDCGRGDLLVLLRKVADHFESIPPITLCGFVQLTGKYQVDGRESIRLEAWPEWVELKTREVSRTSFWWGWWGGGIGQGNFFWYTLGIRLFLSLIDPDFRVFELPPEHEGQSATHAFGLWDGSRRSLVLATEDALIAYGSLETSDQLMGHLRRWTESGMPVVGSFDLSVYPIDRSLSTSDNQWLVRRQESQFLWSLPH